MKDFGGLGEGEVSALFVVFCLVHAMNFDARGAAEGDNRPPWIESNCPGWIVDCADVVEEVAG